MQRVLGLALVLGVAGVPRSLESSDSSSDPPLHVEGTFPVPSDPSDPRNDPAAAARREAIDQHNAMEWPGPWGRDSKEEDALVIGPLAGAHRFTLIMIHGIGSSGHGWSDLMPGLDKLLPAGVRGHVKYVLPHAPTIPITFNLGYRMPAWFDVLALDGSRPEDSEGLEASRMKIENFIEREMEGIPAERIALAGFSQGAALALHTALRTDKLLAGVASLSGWVPMAEEYPSALGPTAKDLRVFFGHGEQDPIVKYSWGVTSHNLVNEWGVDAVMVSSPTLEHSTDVLIMEQLASFLGGRFCENSPEPASTATLPHATPHAPTTAPNSRRSLEAASTSALPPPPGTIRISDAIPDRPALVQALESRRVGASETHIAGGTCGAHSSAAESWFGAWQEKLEEWWAAAPQRDALSACAATLGVHLAQRLETQLARRGLIGGAPAIAAERGAAPALLGSNGAGLAPLTRADECAWVSDASQVELPDFPSLPSELRLPPIAPIPSLLPRVQWMTKWSEKYKREAKGCVRCGGEQPTSDVSMGVSNHQIEEMRAKRRRSVEVVDATQEVAEGADAETDDAVAEGGSYEDMWLSAEEMEERAAAGADGGARSTELAAQGSYEDMWLSAEEMERFKASGELPALLREEELADAEDEEDMWLSAAEMEALRAKQREGGDSQIANGGGFLEEVADASTYEDMWLTAEEMEKMRAGGGDAIAMSDDTYDDFWVSSAEMDASRGMSEEEKLELSRQIGEREWAEWFEAHGIEASDSYASAADGTSAAIGEGAGLALGAALGFGASALLFLGGASAMRARRFGAAIGRPSLRRQTSAPQPTEVQLSAAGSAPAGGTGGLMSS